MNKLLPVLAILLIQVATAQSFGQNKVQYRTFHWQFIKSPHFDIYYYGDGLELAEFTADAAEEAYEQISKHLRWTLKKPVSIIVYNSHNDFQQTNVVDTYMAEGIGGVTELFKNRVVLPFEGSYQQFRHVIHHELVHALVNDMVYGGNIQGIISGKIRLRIPLWVNEGLAEYLSSNWDTKADMIIRDMAIHDQMPNVRYLDSYMAYKGGQSVWRFIAEKYGREKVGEIFINMKKLQNAEKGYEQALGMDFDDLTDHWQKYLKKEYWPDVAGRVEIEDIAKRLTDHEKKKNFYNISPAISPDGSKIAILSDRSGYADIYLIDAMNGEEIRRLIKGNRSIDFEELKWLQPGISWAPDSKRIIIASKAGKWDAFHLIDVKTGKSEKLSFEMDGLFTASWSHDGTRLAFVGNKGKASDIYVYDFKTKELINLTDDIFSDSDPIWNPDGSKIAFVSDRDANIWATINPGSGEKLKSKMFSHDYFQNDIYVVEVKTKNITRVTNTEYDENYPVWTHNRNVLFYTADDQGVWNIFMHNLDTGEYGPVTNVLTGIQQLSLSKDDNMLVFAGYNKGGWDIYSMTSPLDLHHQEVQATNFIANKDQDESLADLRQDKRHKKKENGSTFGDYALYIFAPQYDQYNHAILDQDDDLADEFQDSLRQTEEYFSQPYKTRFTLDLIAGDLYISTVFGAQGMTYFSWSDIMGDHKIFLGTEMVLTLKDSDYFLSYAYLKNQTDLFLSVFQTANFFPISYISFGRLRHIGLGTYLSRPFNRFNRIETGISYYIFDYQIFKDQDLSGEYQQYQEEKLSAVLPVVSWVFDNSVFGYTGPVDGFRQNVSILVSPGMGIGKLKFQTLKFDARRYFRFGKYYTIAGRFMFGKSMGQDAQKFFLGGTPNWYFGRGETNGEEDSGQFRRVILDESNENILKDIYFTEYAMPVRGTRYAERVGTNVALVNMEFRFPFIFALGPPSRVAATYVFGHTFFDIGAAWDNGAEFNDDRELSVKYEDDVLTPIVAGFGMGIKIFTPLGLLRIDAAWDVNPEGGYSKPQYYFSFGPDW